MSFEPDDERYLWDRTGEPEPEVQRLEGLLARYGLGDVPDWEELEGAQADVGRAPWLAAAVVILAASLWWGSHRDDPVPVGYPVRGVAGQERAEPGSWVETRPFETAEIDLGVVGSVDLHPEGRLRIDRSETNQHRLFLERGRMEALILAPPRVFGVGTPAGESVDLGCMYEMEVDEDGNTRVEVLAGAVSFEGEGRWVYVPGGAVCTASRGGGPTPPVWKDQVAWIGQVDALARAEEPETAGALELLAKLDSLTLWHLLGARSDWVRRESLSQLQRREPVTGDFSPEELIGDSDRERSTLLRQLPWYF